MMNMDQEAYSELSLRELRILDTLLHQRSITRTAQSMETTQPAISKVLRRLRAQFSDPLFSLLLTDVGMIRFLPPLIARMAAIAPNISVRAVPLDARQFEYRLET